MALPVRSPQPNAAAPTLRTTRKCAACGSLVTVPGLTWRHIPLPLYCEQCSPVGAFGPARREVGLGIETKDAE